MSQTRKFNRQKERERKQVIERHVKVVRQRLQPAPETGHHKAFAIKENWDDLGDRSGAISEGGE